MSDKEKTALMIKGIMSELSAVEREACDEVADHIRRIIEQAGKGVGLMALALVGAEYAAKKD